MGKGEIARYEQFLLFPQCFQKACFSGASKGVIVWEWVNFCNGGECKIQDETHPTLRLFFFKMLGVKHSHTGPRFNVSSERLLVILVGQQEDSNSFLCSDPRYCVHESYALPTELYPLVPYCVASQRLNVPRN